MLREDELYVEQLRDVKLKLKLKISSFSENDLNVKRGLTAN